MVHIFIALLFILALMRLFAAHVYDIVIVRMTSRWYHAVIDVLEPSSRVLDIGIGTASALARNAALVREKRLHFVGVDYEAAYIDRASRVLGDAKEY